MTVLPTGRSFASHVHSKVLDANGARAVEVPADRQKMFDGNGFAEMCRPFCRLQSFARFRSSEAERVCRSRKLGTRSDLPGLQVRTKSCLFVIKSID